MQLEQVSVLIGGSLDALGERAADLVEYLERCGEVCDVHVGVGEDAREDEAVLWVGRGAPTTRSMVRPTRDEADRRTSMAALAPAAWNGVIACAYGCICDDSQLRYT